MLMLPLMYYRIQAVTKNKTHFDDYMLPTFFTLVVLLLAFSHGMNEGLSLFKSDNFSDKSLYLLKLRHENEQDVFLMRILERGVLISQNQYVFFYPQADIQYLILKLNPNSLEIPLRFLNKKAAE